MSKTEKIEIRIEEKFKNQISELCGGLGVSLTQFAKAGMYSLMNYYLAGINGGPEEVERRMAFVKSLVENSKLYELKCGFSSAESEEDREKIITEFIEVLTK